MGSRPRDLISIRDAARRCGFKHKRSIIRAAAAGRITIHKVDDRWFVSAGQLRVAPMLTAGVLAKKAGCSTKTVSSTS